MKITQIVNNNLVFSEDSQGNEIIVVGKGIGFHGKKGDLLKPQMIEKIFTIKDEAEKDRFMMMIREIVYSNTGEPLHRTKQYLLGDRFKYVIPKN